MRGGRRNVVVLLAAMLLGAVLAGSVGTWMASKRPPSYTSRAVLMVSPASPTGAGAFLDRVPTMAKLAQTDEVLMPAAKELGFPDSASLQDYVAVESPAKTILINVTAHSPDARRSQQIAGTVAQSLRTALTQLYGKDGPVSQAVVASVVDPPPLGEAEESVTPSIIGLVAALLGAGTAFAVVSVWRAARGSGG